MLFSLKKTFFRFSFSKAPWFDSQGFSAKRAFGNLNDSTEQINYSLMEQMAGKLSSYRNLFYFKQFSFLIDSIKSVSSSKSKWDSLSRLLYINSPPFLFFSTLFQDTMSNKILSFRKDNASSPLFKKTL